jgi:alkanesulfonate monooxygenase SsuD/methylene tetrahydromethanopterin reductase-like flavin-dependent oxidoreductase (luciferase family)
MWTTPDHLGSTIVPAVTKAAAGRARPQVAVGLLASVTADPDATRARVAADFAAATALPTFQAMLERQGLGDAGDTLVVGDEDVVRAAVRRYADAGATEAFFFAVGLPEDHARTLALLADVAAEHRTS